MDGNGDLELIRAYQRGDEHALTELFERYRRPLYRYLDGLFDGNTANADDAFQETWLRIIKALPKFDPASGNFGAWAFRIAHNQAMQSFRKSRINDKVGALTGDGELPDRPGATLLHLPPDVLLNDAQLGKKIQAALDDLPPEQKEVFLLRRQNVSFKEIAEIQRCPLNTALSRMRYVILHLRRELAGML